MTRKTNGKSELNESAKLPNNNSSTGLRQWNYILYALLLAYLVFAGMNAWRVPTGSTGYQNAPDEAAHVTYIRVAQAGKLPTQLNPTQGINTNSPTYEWHQPPLYYFIAAIIMPLGEKSVRCVSILFGLISILLIFLTARKLFTKSEQIAVTAVGIAALIPGHVAIMSAVNNDSLLELCFSCFLYVLAQCIMDGISLKRSLALGAILGFGLLTKATALLLIPLLLFAAILLWRTGEKPKKLVQNLTVVFGMAVLISGWWIVRNTMLYHEPLPLHAFVQSFEGTAKAQDVINGTIGLKVDGWTGYYILLSQWTFKSFWAVFGTAQSALYGVPRFLPEVVYTLLGLVSIAVAAGMGRLHFKRRVDFTGRQLSVILIFGAVIGLVSCSFLLFTHKYFQAQGRYFYPAMLPFSIIFAMGWRAIFPVKYSDLACVILLILLGTISVLFLVTIW